MIGVIDYGVGNLFSLRSSLEAIGEACVVSSDSAVLRACDRLILPGVGAFADAADRLRQTGLDRLVLEQAARGKPMLGICLGMQLLFDRSLEYGEHAGLGLIRGTVVPIRDVIPETLKIPHIGWNALIPTKPCPLFSELKTGDCVYFVHSFYAADCDENVVAVAEYGAELTAAVQKQNVFGCQFHPEKSGKVGLTILRAFCQTEAAR